MVRKQFLHAAVMAVAIAGLAGFAGLANVAMPAGARCTFPCRPTL